MADSDNSSPNLEPESPKSLEPQNSKAAAVWRPGEIMRDVVGRVASRLGQSWSSSGAGSDNTGSEDGSFGDWRRPAKLGYIIIFFTFVVLGGWSAYAPLDSAVVAPGIVTLESSRKIIQHFEGGIVRKILVHEGQHVEQGDVLILLDNTQPQASADMAYNQYYALLAQEARLLAERDRAETINFPSELSNKIDDPVIAQAVSDQRKQFVEHRASLAGQVSILESRVQQYGTEIEGITVEKTSTESQLGFINSELTDLRGLLEKNLVQKTRVLAMEREKSRLEGVIGRATADIAKAQNGIGETQLNIEQLHKKDSEDVNTQILDTRVKLGDLREKVMVSQDILRRIEIRAPRSGTVQNVHVATIGGVIRAGEPLLELIPDDEGLVVDAQVSPTDIDAIQAGMRAEIRFSAFHGQILPLIMGKVESVSRDRINDEQKKSSYFLARVTVDKNEVPAMVKGRITAGMAAEVIVPTGERTVLSYLVRPLRNRVSTTFREK
jgi:HlyD family type I secretion membrane fusion protein